MWTQYDIIVETLTGSEFQVTVTDKDTVGYIKSRIQKYEGIPIGQQHLLFNHQELIDSTELRDVPLTKGSRLKLVLDIKGGPVSARRAVNLPDYDSWFDLSDVLNTTRQDPLRITFGYKLLVYKDAKKNIHRVMKLRKDNKNGSSSSNQETTSSSGCKTKRNNGSGSASSCSSSCGGSSSPDTLNDQDHQWLKDNMQTLDKMHQLQAKINSKKRNKKFQSNIKSDRETETASQPDQTSDGDPNNCDRYPDEFKLTLLKLGSMDDRPDSKRGKNDETPEQETECRSLGKYNFPPVKTSICSGPNSSPILKRDNLTGTTSKSPPNNQLNKHGISKACLRSPNLQSIEKQQGRKSPTPIPQTKPPLTPPTNQPVNPSKRMPGSMHYDSHEKYRINRLNRQREYVRTEVRTSLMNSVFGDGYFNGSESSFSDRESFLKSFSDQIYANQKDRDNLQDRKSSVPRSMTNTTTTTAYRTSVNNKNKSMGQQKPFVNDITTSVNDIINRFSSATQLNGESSKEIDPNDRLSRQFSVKSINNTSTVNDGNGCENRLPFISGGDDGGGNKFQTTTDGYGGLIDGSFRLYKLSSEAPNNYYELPKLLIREDSPVESIHASDPQLETIALRCDSPKTETNACNASNSTGGPYSLEDCCQSTDSILSSISSSTNAADDITSSTDSILKSPWSQNSDLAINNLELSFLNDDYPSDCDGFDGVDVMDGDSTQSAYSSILKISSGSGGQASCWPTITTPAYSTSTTNRDKCKSIFTLNKSTDSKQPVKQSFDSLNLQSNDSRVLSSILSSDDEDGYNNSCESVTDEKLPKSSRIGPSEFRITFGSSPTLLSTNNQMSEGTRLDAVPFQYRRGYTNLNDACLSSSTSNLETFSPNKIVANNVSEIGINHKRISEKSASQELSTMLKHNPANNFDHVRSFEHLDRSKIIRMKNETTKRRNSAAIPQSNETTSAPTTESVYNNEENGVQGSVNYNRNDWKIHNHFERERNVIVQEEDSNDDFSYSNLAYDYNNMQTIGGVGGYPVGYRQSNESLFNLNFENLDDEVFEIDAMSLFPLDSDEDDITVDPPADRPSETVSETDKSKPPNKSIRSKSIDVRVEMELPVSTKKQLEDVAIGGRSAMPQKPRCAKCNRKLGLIMIMRCHCDGIFCAQHRYAEAHNCSYNFKQMGKKMLEREMPKVVAQKLPKI